MVAVLCTGDHKKERGALRTNEANVGIRLRPVLPLVSHE